MGGVSGSVGGIRVRPDRAPPVARCPQRCRSARVPDARSGRPRPGEAGAEAVGVLLAGDEDSVRRTPSPSLHRRVAGGRLGRRDATRGRRRLPLIPELSAVLEHLAATGLLSGLGAVVVLDLGYTGSTVSVVDVESGTVRATERTALCVAEIGGVVDLADELLTQTGCGADAVVLVGGGATAAAIRERVADLAGSSRRRAGGPRVVGGVGRRAGREQRAGPGGVVAATDSASTDRTPTRRASPRLSPRRVPPSGAQRRGGRGDARPPRRHRFRAGLRQKPFSGPRRTNRRASR